MSRLCSPQRPLHTAVSLRSAGLHAAAARGSALRSAACARVREAWARAAVLPCVRGNSAPPGALQKHPGCPASSWCPSLYLFLFVFKLEGVYLFVNTYLSPPFASEEARPGCEVRPGG